MKEIKLTQGQVALVDDEDYEYLNQWKWYANKSKNTYYAVRGVYSDGKRDVIHMHRVIMNPSDNMYIDHINHNGLNNCKSNLRECTPSENQRNRLPKNGERYLGIAKYRNSYQVYLGDKYIGYFKTDIEAAKAYDIAAYAKYGKFANLNFKS